jgi:hypothetical protein
VRELLNLGCAAGGYRLAGTVLDHVCCRHLYGTDRMLTAWSAHDEAVILLVGPHDRSPLDVYDQLLSALGLQQTEAERAKPACCEEDLDPPVDSDLSSSIVNAVETLARWPKRRALPGSPWVAQLTG